MIGLKISRHFLSQSEAKPKPIVARLRLCWRVDCMLDSSFDWFAGLLVSIVIGQNDNMYFGLWPLQSEQEHNKRKPKRNTDLVELDLVERSDR